MILYKIAFIYNVFNIKFIGLKTNKIPMANSYNSELARSIIFASLVIAGSLIYFGTQYTSVSPTTDSMTDEEFNEKVAEGIDEYIEKQIEEKNAPKVVEGDFTDDDAILGDPDAPVTIVEFSDFQCPYCVRFYEDTLPELKEKYIDTGKVRFVYRDFPLSFHKAATPAAILAECTAEQAGDEAYYKIHDKVFETISSGYDEDALIAYAVELGVDENELKTCLEDEDEDMLAEINADMKDGQSAGINGTPGFLVNGQVLSGAQPFSVFESIIENELSNS